MIKFFQTDFNMYAHKELFDKRVKKKEKYFFSFLEFTYALHTGRVITCCSFFERKQCVKNDDRWLREKTMCVCMDVICLQHNCYSIFVLLCENCVDRTRKNVVMLVQSILQLNRSRFLLLHRHIYIYTYIHHHQPTTTARYISLVFPSLLLLLPTVWKEIRHRQTTPYRFW